MSGLRGFGFTLDLATGRSRKWYVGSDGVERWADNDEPTKPQGPSIVCAACGQAEVGIFDPICADCRAAIQGATHEG